MKFDILESVLESGLWGTIGPHSMKSAESIAHYCNKKHAVLVYSAKAALETLLRSLEITYGDKVIMASYSDPANSLITAAIGACPVFADIDCETGMISPESVEAAIKKNGSTIKALISDDNTSGNFERLAEICSGHNIALIENAGIDFSSSPSPYALATVYDLGEKSTLDIGKGGVIVTDSTDCYAGAFSYHNCGRAPGGGSTTLNFDDIIGGNCRITEWQACLVSEAIKEVPQKIKLLEDAVARVSEQFSSEFLRPVKYYRKNVVFCYYSDRNGGIPLGEFLADKNGLSAGYSGNAILPPMRAMHRQPVFEGVYGDEGLDHSIMAEENFVFAALEI